MYEGKVRDYASESDADALHTAHQIRSDGKRHAKAMKAMKAKTKHSDSYGACYKSETLMLDDQSGNVEPESGDVPIDMGESRASKRAEGK